MKKLFLMLFGALLLAACSGPQVPNPVAGTIPPGVNSMQQIEQAIQTACTKAKWQVVEKGNGYMNLTVFSRGMGFAAQITYNPQSYTISFGQVTYTERDMGDAYALYRKLSMKLNRTIQRYLLTPAAQGANY